jgi:hypothetical protein
VCPVNAYLQWSIKDAPNAANPAFFPPLANISKYVDVMDYIRRLVGIDYISIGSDFTLGNLPDRGGTSLPVPSFVFPPEMLYYSRSLEYVQNFNQVANLPILRAELLRRGYSFVDIDAFRACLPILGTDGSLSSVAVDSPARGKVFAKTGTNVGFDPLGQRLLVQSKALAASSSGLTASGRCSTWLSMTLAARPTSPPYCRPTRTLVKSQPSYGKKPTPTGSRRFDWRQDNARLRWAGGTAR